VAAARKKRLLASLVYDHPEEEVIFIAWESCKKFRWCTTKQFAPVAFTFDGLAPFGWSVSPRFGLAKDMSIQEPGWILERTT